MNKVYIVIINYNKFEHTIECLESVLKSSYLNIQVFVIDNSSDNLSLTNLSNWIINNDYRDIKTKFNDLVLPPEQKPLNHCILKENEFIESKNVFKEKIIIVKVKNRGFAAANNIALRYILTNATSSSLIWVLNNDTIVEKNTLSNLVQFYHENKSEKYILGSKLRYYDKPATIQAVAGKYNKWLGKHYHVGEGEQDNGQYDTYQPGKMDYIVGASIFIPKLFLEQAGMMCEDYFLYFEELDWIKTGSQHGFTISLVPNAVVYHKEGSSIVENNGKKRDTRRSEYYSITNRVRFIKKWYPSCLLTVMPGVIWAIMKRVALGKFSLVKKTTVAIIKILFSNNPGQLKYEN